MILHGDCRQQLATLDDCSVDSIVTDPPYELGFMGKKWDASGIAYDPTVWAECLRVLKPGGHLLAFGGTRTYHRMAVAIEDAGFEIRDSLHWLYGSGFPKSLDVSKAIDKQRDDRADILKVTNWICDALKASGRTHADVLNAFGFNPGSGMVGHWTARTIGSQPAVPTLEQVPTLLDVLTVTADDVPDEIRHLLWDLNGRKGQPGENWAKREIIGERDVPVGHSFAGPVYGGDSSSVTVDVTAPATDAAKAWDGWGTALKPAHEPIVLARKPLVGTVAANVMAYGTGALNIDGCRIAGADTTTRHNSSSSSYMTGTIGTVQPVVESYTTGSAAGRWPANLILTHSPDCHTECVSGCPVAALNTQSGPVGSWSNSRGGDWGTDRVTGMNLKHQKSQRNYETRGGGASRFFTTTEWDPEIDVPFLYVAKPSRRERNAGLDGMPEQLGGSLEGGNDKRKGDKPQLTPRANFHPTVKPVALMRHLVRLVTRPGGTVLDPFLGSGTTAVAATLEGFDWIGCELTDDYLPIIQARVAWAEQHQPEPDLTLFTDAQ